MSDEEKNSSKSSHKYIEMLVKRDPQTGKLVRTEHGKSWLVTKKENK